MLIRLLCAHEMNKCVCKISHLNSKRLLRKLQKLLGGYFILPHPVEATCDLWSWWQHYKYRPGIIIIIIITAYYHDRIWMYKTVAYRPTHVNGIMQ